MPPKPPENLARFQEKLLELLWNGGAPEDIRAALLSDPKLSDFRDYIAAMDLRMIEVAGKLVRKWGVGKEP